MNKYMDWLYWIGKEVFVKLKNGSVYSGIVHSVDDSDFTIIFFTMTDKYGKRVTFVTSEIERIKEEGENGKTN